MEFRVGIVGLGFVGTAVETGLQSVPGVKIHTHDKFKDTESLATVVDESDIIFMCLPTPMREDRSCDTTILEDVVYRTIHLDQLFGDKGKTIVIKSTVPPKTTEYFAKRYPEHTFIFNPEFLTQRNFIKDFLEQDRILIGTTPGYNETKVREVTDLYREFTKTQDKPGAIFQVDSRVAEMLKYTTNSFLATKGSFFNEIKEICQAAEIDYDAVRTLLHLDERIGKTHTQVPGWDGKHGWGGACFPKDVNGLIAFAEQHGVDALMLESAWVKNISVREDFEWEGLAQVTGKYEKDD
jgi:UDPglucose 6-dehydrogenase